MPNKNKNKLTSAQKDLCLELFKIGAIKFGDFKLKLHDKFPKAPLSPIYIDLRILRRFPKAKKMAISVYLELLRPLKFDVLADIPTAATPLVSSISDSLKIGQMTPRADTKAHGTGAKIDGMIKNDRGKRAVLIDDLVTKADSKLEAANTLKSASIKVADVVVLVDRQQGGEEQMKKAGLKLHSAFTLSQMLDFYLASKLLTRKQFEDIKIRLEQLTKFQKK